MGDVCALGQSWVIVSEKGTEDGALGCNVCSLGSLLVGDFVYQPVASQWSAAIFFWLYLRLNAEHITHELALVALLI